MRCWVLGLAVVWFGCGGGDDDEPFDAGATDGAVEIPDAGGGATALCNGVELTYARASWIDVFDGLANGASFGSHLFISGGEGTEMFGGPFVREYGAGGVVEWERVFDTSGFAAMGVAANVGDDSVAVGHFTGTVDFGGGVRSSGAATAGAAFAVALDSAGSYRWDHVFVPQGDDLAIALTVAMRPDGSVVVGGQFSGSVDFGGGVRVGTNSPNGFVVAFDGAGSYLWDRTFVPGTGGSSGIHALAVGSGGQVVAAGLYKGPIDFGGGVRSGQGPVAIALEPNGAYRWDRAFDEATFFNAFRGAAIDPLGRVILAAPVSGTVDFGGGARTGPAMMLLQLDGANGAYRWDRVFSVDVSFKPVLAVDGLQGIVVSGGFEGGDFGGGMREVAGGLDAFVLALDADGGYRWDEVIGTRERDGIQMVAIDDDGDIAVGGMCGSTDFGGFEGFVLHIPSELRPD